jgi:hypothetical protein
LHNPARMPGPSDAAVHEPERDAPAREPERDVERLPRKDPGRRNAPVEDPPPGATDDPDPIDDPAPVDEPQDPEDE